MRGEAISNEIASPRLRLASTSAKLIHSIKIDAAPRLGRNPVMISPAYVRLMAEYNAEMNRRLYAAAARLSDADRRADRGAFWGSIHGSLNHLLWGYTQWMSRFDNWEKPSV